MDMLSVSQSVGLATVSFVIDAEEVCACVCVYVYDIIVMVRSSQVTSLYVALLFSCTWFFF